MFFSLSMLALSGLASAILPHPQGEQTRSHIPPPSLNFKRHLLERDTAPCKVISEAYKAANVTEGKTTVIDVPPSVGIACLKSIPVDKERDIALIEWIVPYVQFHTTIDVLKNPPQEYLFPGVDVLGGLDKVKSKLQSNGYASQYDVMTDIRSVFVASRDNHFHYFAPIFNIFDYVRPEIQFISLSSDGLRTPTIYMMQDIKLGNKGKLDYFPSAVSSVDGIGISQWIQNNAVMNIAGCQDPDAAYNSQLTALPRLLNGAGDITSTQFEIPDQHVVRFRNGTQVALPNRVRIYPAADFSNINSGEDVHKAFELPTATPTTAAATSATLEPTATETGSTSTETESAAPTAIPGYPYPAAIGPLDSISGYFLNETGYEDVAVLAILNFEPSSEPDGFDANEWSAENFGVVSDFLQAAHKANRDKLVIDMSGNGGGIIMLANGIYRLLFPDGKFDAYERYRATPFLQVSSEVAYESLASGFYNDGPFNTEGKNITSGKEWYGPYSIKGGQKMTDAAKDKSADYFQPLVTEFYKEEKKKSPWLEKALFKPENILIVTDGLCGSSCTILTGLLTRNYGIRTLALGGRPMKQAMQAMGGVKGTLQLPKSTVQAYETIIVSGLEDNVKAFTTYNASASQYPSANSPLRESGISIAVNGLSSYRPDDVDGYPVHFQYQAANCRLFYTQQMAATMPGAWTRAAGVAWKGQKCVSGSSTGDGDTIGDDLVAFNPVVRNKGAPISSPGNL